MVVPTKMIGDTVDYMEWKTGERNEGMAFSLLTFISKLTGSLCTAIATAIIPVIGLVTVQLADNSLQLVENPQINTRFWLWSPYSRPWRRSSRSYPTDSMTSRARSSRTFRKR